MRLGKTMQKLLVELFVTKDGMSSFDIQLFLDCEKQQQYKMCNTLQENGFLKYFKEQRKTDKKYHKRIYILTQKGIDLVLSRSEMNLKAIRLCEERKIPFYDVIREGNSFTASFSRSFEHVSYKLQRNFLRELRQKGSSMLKIVSMREHIDKTIEKLKTTFEIESISEIEKYDNEIEDIVTVYIDIKS